MNELGAQFLDRIQAAAVQLARVDEDLAILESRPGGWLRKQEMGHLLDSAQNNHQRIVMAALNGRYEGPGYEQNEWVDLHGYDQFRWADLCSYWRARNRMLAHVVGRLTPSQLGAAVTVGLDKAVSLEDLIVDYLRHLDHHVSQITALLPADDDSVAEQPPQSED